VNVLLVILGYKKLIHLMLLLVILDYIIIGYLWLFYWWLLVIIDYSSIGGSYIGGY
jgi:hypothetical protein